METDDDDDMTTITQRKRRKKLHCGESITECTREMRLGGVVEINRIG